MIYIHDTSQFLALSSLEKDAICKDERAHPIISSVIHNETFHLLFAHSNFCKPSSRSFQLHFFNVFLKVKFRKEKLSTKGHFTDQLISGYQVTNLAHISFVMEYV